MCKRGACFGRLTQIANQVRPMNLLGLHFTLPSIGTDSVFKFMVSSLCLQGLSYINNGINIRNVIQRTLGYTNRSSFRNQNNSIYFTINSTFSLYMVPVGVTFKEINFL